MSFIVFCMVMMCQLFWIDEILHFYCVLFWLYWISMLNRCCICSFSYFFTFWNSFYYCGKLDEFEVTLAFSCASVFCVKSTFFVRLYIVIALDGDLIWFSCFGLEYSVVWVCYHYMILFLFQRHRILISVLFLALTEWTASLLPVFSSF